MTYIIGLTGGIGSGKTAASQLFEQQGIHVVDADEVAHSISRKPEIIEQVKTHFGSEYITADQQMDRPRLREKIFNDIEAKQWLEGLLHPRIRNQMMQDLRSATSPYVILSAPLLLENKLDKLVNRVLVIDVSEATQRERASARDNNSLETIEKIMGAQISRKDRLSKADDVIDNEGSLAALEKQVLEHHKNYLSAAEKEAAAEPPSSP